MDDAQDGTFDITAEMAKEEDDLTARHKKEEEERARQARQSYYVYFILPFAMNKALKNKTIVAEQVVTCGQTGSSLLFAR